MKYRHALLEMSTHKIVADATTKKAIVKKAQPIINKHPRRKYRYAKIGIEPTMPWFKKGE